MDTRTLINPFPGLRPFMQEEADLFFGRDKQSDELVRRLASRRFLAVVGTSGSGKSSLVRAGLLPSLEGGFMAGAGAHWRMAILRPQDDPIRFLARAIVETGVLAPLDLAPPAAESVIETTLRRSSLGLVEAARLARLEPHENLLILVDQFEELFRFADLARQRGAGDEAPAFVKLLLEAARQTDVPVYVVITMRSDFLGDCARFRDLPEAISDSQYLIPCLTRDELQAVITGPIGVRGGRIAPSLVQRLLNDVGDDMDQLPVLQHALMRAWDHWERSDPDARPIELSDLEAIGGMAEALSRHAGARQAASGGLGGAPAVATPKGRLHFLSARHAPPARSPHRRCDWPGHRLPIPHHFTSPGPERNGTRAIECSCCTRHSRAGYPWRSGIPTHSGSPYATSAPDAAWWLPTGSDLRASQSIDWLVRCVGATLYVMPPSRRKTPYGSTLHERRR